MDTTARAPQFMEQENLDNARAILEGMSHYRINPLRIRITDATRVQKGGQGVVTPGTLTLPETVKELVSMLKVIAEDFGVTPENFKKSLQQVKERLEDWPPEMDAMAEMIGISPEALDEWHPEMKVAVKMLVWNRDDIKESTKFFKSFVHELSLVVELCHPNVIRLAGFVEDMEKGDAWMILPWESNGNVREFLRSGEWDIPERISLIQDTASGLEYLHGRQPPICHGDLKSLNILVNSSYRAVITDFGSARIGRNVASGERENPPVDDGRAAEWTSPEVKFNPSTLELTLTGPKFSLRWTAPEVLAGEEQDLPSDMWAIGWICWEIVTGRIPLEGLDTEVTIVKHTIEGKLPAVRENVDLSHVLKLCDLMSQCWVLKQANRINAFKFRQKVDFVPSAVPSGHGPGGQKLRSAALLQALGTMYRLQNDLAMAMAYYQAAINVATQTEDEKAGANALNGLGEIFHAQSMNVEAKQAFQEAQEIYSRIGDYSGVGNALLGLGNAYRAQLQHYEAEKAFMDAYEVHSRMRSDVGIADALIGLGNTGCAQSRYREAEKAFKEAYEIHSRIGNDRGAANALSGLGNTRSARSNHRDAEGTFNRQDATHAASRDPSDNQASPPEADDGIETLVIWASSSPIRVNGHFGDVFQGIHKVVGKVALKRPRVEDSDYSKAIIRRLEREANTWKTLKHPHVLEFLGTLKRDGHLYLVSPFIEKGTVVEYAARFPRIDRVKLLRETASALDYLHTRGVVHGDVKGNNILLGDKDSALLCDFGLAKMAPSRTSTAMKGAGSVRWMAPELWYEAEKSPQTDVYAFGMTIAEVLTGDVPLPHRSNDLAFVFAVENNDERPLTDPMFSPDGLSYRVAWEVARACWSRDPSARISMSEAFQSLRT